MSFLRALVPRRATPLYLTAHRRLAPCSALRAFSNSRSANNAELDDGKQKPKATTPLRRKAADSLPIRANPTPTRGSIRPVLTLTTAERYNLPLLARTLPSGSRPVADAYWVPRWQDGELFVFQNGSTVSWGLEERQLQEFQSVFLSRPGVEIERLIVPETEELEFVTDPEEDTRLQGDLIILGQQPPLEDPDVLPPAPTGPEPSLPIDSLAARYAYSQALARSTALSALEEALDKYLLSVSTLPQSLAKTGKPGLSKKQLLIKLGQLLKFRQGLNLNAENFADTPELYWAEPVMETYFNRLSDALEIKQRVVHMNSKITYAGEVQSTLRELINTSAGHGMEQTIILLIFVEVVIVLTLNWRDLRDVITNKESESPSERRRH